MNELSEEIKLTMNLMQTDIDESAHDELQGHLYSLLEMKRNEIQRRLAERSLLESATHNQSPYNSPIKLYGYITDAAKPLTAGDLKLGGWWCADTSEDSLNAFSLFGLKDKEYSPWDGSFYGCFLYENGSNLLDRGFRHHTEGLKQIHRVGNEFYWNEK